MCKSSRACSGNLQDASNSRCLETFTLTNDTNVYLQNQMHLSTCLTYIVSLSIIFSYIVYNTVIVRGTNYFVLWNDVHISIYFILKGSNSSPS